MALCVEVVTPVAFTELSWAARVSFWSSLLQFLALAWAKSPISHFLVPVCPSLSVCPPSPILKPVIGQRGSVWLSCSGSHWSEYGYSQTTHWFVQSKSPESLSVYKGWNKQPYNCSKQSVCSASHWPESDYFPNLSWGQLHVRFSTVLVYVNLCAALCIATKMTANITKTTENDSSGKENKEISKKGNCSYMVSDLAFRPEPVLSNCTCFNKTLIYKRMK